MGPAVSVVMPVRDGADLLPRAVESVRAQTFGLWELLVTDDGSTDATPELLAGYAAADPRVHVFRHAAARGVSAARNTAIRGPVRTGSRTSTTMTSSTRVSLRPWTGGGAAAMCWCSPTTWSRSGRGTRG